MAEEGRPTAEQAVAAVAGARAAAGIPEATALWDNLWEQAGTGKGAQLRTIVRRYIETVTGKRMDELPISRKAISELIKLIQQAKAGGFSARAAMGTMQAALQRIAGGAAAAEGTAAALIAKRPNRPPTPGAAGKLLQGTKPAGAFQKTKAFIGGRPWIGGLAGAYLATKGLEAGLGMVEKRKALKQAVVDVQSQVRSPSEILQELAQEEALERRAVRLAQGNPELAARLSQLVGGQPGAGLSIGGLTVANPAAQAAPNLQQILALMGAEGSEDQYGL